MPRVFDFLLLLYPQRYWREFGLEMKAVLELAAQDRRAEGMSAFACFVVFECVGLLLGAAIEWLPCVNLPVTGGTIAAAFLQILLYKSLLHITR